MFLGKRILSKFTREQSCRSVISIKFLFNFIEIALQFDYSLVNLWHIFNNKNLVSHISFLYCFLIHKKCQISTKLLVLYFLSKFPFTKINGIFFLFWIAYLPYWNRKMCVFWAQSFRKPILQEFKFAKKCPFCKKSLNGLITNWEIR